MNAFLHRITPGVRAILTIMAGGWLILELLPWVLKVVPSAWLVASTADILHGQVWRLVTYPFAEPLDFGSALNALVLFMFGPSVESALGTRRFVRLVAGATVLVALLALVSAQVSGPFFLAGMQVPLLAVFAAYCLLNWGGTILLMFVIPVPIRYFFVFEIIAVMLSPKPMWIPLWSAIGLAYGMVSRNWFMSSNLFARPQTAKEKRRSRLQGEMAGPKVVPIRPELARTPSPTEVEVDRILEKLRLEGMASLNQSERDLLDAHSNALRKRDERA
jgi:membrane associated rhomboid family serine protease